MNRKTIRGSHIITDDGAQHAETVPLKDRIPVFDTNKLHSCDDVTFTPEQKLGAWALVQPQ